MVCAGTFLLNWERRFDKELACTSRMTMTPRKILGSRALVVLHDQEDHPLLVTTHRGDQHLTMGPPAMLTHYEQAAGLASLKRIVVDREGMAAEFLAALAGEGRMVVTVLRTDQYTGVESFREVGAFIPLQALRHGNGIWEM